MNSCLDFVPLDVYLRLCLYLYLFLTSKLWDLSL